jgi:hypothetical protein
MNKPERETHTLDTLDFIMCGGLQGLAELLGQNGPNTTPYEPVANRNYPRERVGLRGLVPLAAAAAKPLTGD